MRILFFLLILCFAGQLQAQSIKAFKQYTADKKEYENVKVIPVHSDDEASSYIIFVKKEVKLHKHEVHTEHVAILAGKGVMLLGEERIPVKKGDLVVIPKGTPHSVEVTSRKPMKVLSIQSPKFEGKDRIFIN